MILFLNIFPSSRSFSLAVACNETKNRSCMLVEKRERSNSNNIRWPVALRMCSSFALSRTSPCPVKALEGAAWTCQQRITLLACHSLKNASFFSMARTSHFCWAPSCIVYVCVCVQKCNCVCVCLCLCVWNNMNNRPLSSVSPAATTLSRPCSHHSFQALALGPRIIGLKEINMVWRR